MYLEHFGLGVNPFSLSPKLDFLYKSGTFEESMAHLVYGLDNNEAIVLITGPISTGKTMALQSFLTNLGPRFEFALITNTRVTATELLKLILEDLGVKWPVGVDKSDLLILFKDYLQGANRAGKMVLIVVDEAQNLAPEVLEEIRLLTNLGQGEAQPVQIILVGQPELDETVNRPDLAQIRQRIRVHYRLDPLTRRETEEYLHHRMAVAGCSRRVFTSGAIDRIYAGSRGVPRLVNTMAGEALLSAFVAGHDMVQPADVEEDMDLRFTTGPAPAPIPEAAPTPAPASKPAPAAAPRAEAPRVQGPQIQNPPPAPPRPVMARRNTRGVTGRALRPWAIAALVIVVLGAFYTLGAWEGLVRAIVPQPDQTAVQTPAQTLAQAPAQEQPVVVQEAPGDEVPQAAIDTQAEEEGPVTAAAAEAAAPAAQPEAESPAPVGNDAVGEADQPPTALPVREPASSDQDAFYIHIYSFRTPERAASFVRRWDDPRYDITTRKQDVRGVDWYRVYLGPFVSHEAALLEALRLQGEKTIDYYKVSTLPADPGS